MLPKLSWTNCRCSSVVEQFFRKEEVGGSTPLIGSIKNSYKMNQRIIDNSRYLKEVMVDDHINRWLFVGIVLLVIPIYLIWSKYLVDYQVGVFLKIGVFPLKYLFIILILNTVLAVFSYRKEKEIAYLLMMGSLAITIFIFILEVFYLRNMPNV